MAKVNKSLRRMSLIRQALRIVANICILYHLDAAAGSSDFFFGPFTKTMGADIKFDLEFAVSENFDAVANLFYHSGFPEQFRSYDRALRERIKGTEVNLCIMLPKLTGKTTFWDPLVQGHLAAFKAGAGAPAASGVLTLVAPACSLAKTAAKTKAFALS
jgi:hypothetical protein